jgi:hypothetical protein
MRLSETFDAGDHKGRDSTVVPTNNSIGVSVRYHV